MALIKFSLSKDPTATKLTPQKNAPTKVLVTKNTGFLKGFLCKQGGTLVAIVKSDE